MKPLEYAVGFQVSREMDSDDLYFDGGLEHWVVAQRQRVEDDLMAVLSPELFEWNPIWIAGQHVETLRIHKASGRTKHIDERPYEPDEDEEDY